LRLPPSNRFVGRLTGHRTDEEAINSTGFGTAGVAVQEQDRG
jgi:hypothetical protein